MVMILCYLTLGIITIHYSFYVCNKLQLIHAATRENGLTTLHWLFILLYDTMYIHKSAFPLHLLVQLSYNIANPLSFVLLNIPRKILFRHSEKRHREVSPGDEPSDTIMPKGNWSIKTF